jgi:hypothetical protein
VSTIHGEEDEDLLEPVRSSNWILIAACAVAVLILAAGAVVIGLKYRSAAVDAGAAPPPRRPAPSLSAAAVPVCVQPMTGGTVCQLPSGVTVCVQTSLSQPSCPFGGALVSKPLPMTLPDWLARLPVPVTLSDTDTTRHGEVRLDGALAVVDVGTELGDLVEKVDCQVRADNGKLSRAALDFVRACGLAAVPPGDQSTKANTDWFAAHVLPVDDRQPHLGWYCGPLHAQLILDRGNADLELFANENPPDTCREGDL